MIPHSFLVSFF